MKAKVQPGRSVSIDGSLYEEGSVIEVPDEALAQLVRGGAVVIEPEKAKPKPKPKPKAKKKKAKADE